MSEHKNEHWTNLSEADRLKILAALYDLAKDNPELPRQMEQLAELKRKKPATFKVMLEKLKKL